ncbi:MAG: helix-turn-helix domain-containing protein [Methanobacterium sp.]
MLRAFKYRLYPNNEQMIKFQKHFGACRYIYNWDWNTKSAHTKEKVNLLVVLLLTKK